MFASRILAAVPALLALPGVTMAAMPAPPADNPLLAPWTGPCGGVPPFDRVRPEHFEPAFAVAMAEQVRAVEAIAADPGPASFANTLAALERSGRTLDRVAAVYGVFTSTRSDEEMQAVERRLEPLLAVHRDRIVTDGELFARVQAVHENRAGEPLDAEQRRLAWLHHTTMARHGAALDDAAKRELSAINQELAELFTTFTQRVLADEEGQAVFLEHEADLAGLPQSARDAAAAAAVARGRAGAWTIPNTRSSVEPFLVHSERRDLRERVWRMFVGRGDGGGDTDTNAIAARILALRARRAALLGFATHAHWRLEDSMARTPERALELMEAVWKPAVERVREEVADMQAAADAEAAGIRIEPWDYRHYAEQVRRERYDLDEAEITPYLQLEKLREGMFLVAERLFGLRFRATPPGTVPVHHSDIRVWEVVDRDDRPVGLWYFDPFARPGKRSGAWMSGYRAQARIDGETSAIVSNNCNFTQG
ncbi:MAG: M3 family metallopeptidase, partial [Planctomycetaceae bacterium]